MPRLPFHIQELDTIDPLEAQEDWDAQHIGSTAGRRTSAGSGHRSREEPRVHRFNASEALDRKRADRRKSIRRGRR